MGEHRGLTLHVGLGPLWRHRSDEKSCPHHPSILDVLLGIQGQDFSELEILGSVWSPKGSNQSGPADGPRFPSRCQRPPDRVATCLNYQKPSSCRNFSVARSTRGQALLPGQGRTPQAPSPDLERPGLSHPDISCLLTGGT